jgi:putative transposase
LLTAFNTLKFIFWKTIWNTSAKTVWANKAIFLALCINTEGQKELMGMWVAENEGAKFWLSVLTELQHRGLEDILIACVDGLKGFPDAINAVFPQTNVQLCIVHMVRNSLKYVLGKTIRL